MEVTLDRLAAYSSTLARVSGWICGLLLTVSAFLIGLDIALREPPEEVKWVDPIHKA